MLGKDVELPRKVLLPRSAKPVLGRACGCLTLTTHKRSAWIDRISGASASAKVCHVEHQEKSRSMVGVCPCGRRSGRPTFKRGSGGDSVCTVRPRPGVGAVFCSRLVWSRHQKARTLPKQLLGATAGLSSARAQVAKVQNDLCQPAMAATV